MEEQQRFSLIVTGKVLWIVEERDRNVEWAGPAKQDFEITTVSSPFEAATYLETNDFDVILISLPLPQDSLESAMEEIHAHSMRTPVVVYAPQATLAEAVPWVKLGVSQIVQETSEIAGTICDAIASRQLHTLAARVSDARQPEWRNLLIGHSPKMQNVAEIIRLVAPRRCTVLITGETGTGKEVVARALHAAGNRAHLELVAVNCSALPDHLLEAELFGHVKGAFTGATGLRIGRFEQANRGTLFLDEIGDMPLPLQAKLLRVLQEREFQRLGSSETIRVDVRVIAATNTNLIEKVQRGEFREDLYYRLNVVPIALPSIRERLGDIPALVHFFAAKISRAEGIPVKDVPDEVLKRLMTQEWPGNVRQIENAVEMAIALSGERQVLCPADFPAPFRACPIRTASLPFFVVPDYGLDYEQTVGNFELNILEQALRKTGGNKKLAADMLQLKRTTLAAKLKTLSSWGEAALAQ